MMLTVLIPWRPQPSRFPALEAVFGWYEDNFERVEIRTMDSDDELFNLARCRNLAIDSVVDRDEVVIINDADTIPQIEPLRAAIAAAAASGLVHLPYNRYHWLGTPGTTQFLAGTPAEDCEFELVTGACSGVYVTTARTWWNHGGQDERFRGWGFEDAAWYLAHETLLDQAPKRHDGAVFALHHSAQVREGTQYDANAALMQQYRDASIGQDAMRQLVGSDATARYAR